jgi:hypothetical protein
MGNAWETYEVGPMDDIEKKTWTPQSRPGKPDKEPAPDAPKPKPEKPKK